MREREGKRRGGKGGEEKRREGREGKGGKGRKGREGREGRGREGRDGSWEGGKRERERERELQWQRIICLYKLKIRCEEKEERRRKKTIKQNVHYFLLWLFWQCACTQLIIYSCLLTDAITFISHDYYSTPLISLLFPFPFPFLLHSVFIFYLPFFVGMD